MSLRIGDIAPDKRIREAISPPSVTDEEALKQFLQGWETHRPYPRTVKLAS